MYDICWNEDNNIFVICGDSFVRFYYINSIGKDPLHTSDNTLSISYKPGKMERYNDSIFTTVKFGNGLYKNILYASTNAGVLCTFSTSLLMEKWLDIGKGPMLCMDINSKYILLSCVNGINIIVNIDKFEYIGEVPSPLSIKQLNDINNSMIGEDEKGEYISFLFAYKYH